MFTVEQIRADIAPFTLDSGKCRDSKYVLDYINTARRILWARGNFVGLMDTLRINAYDGQLTLPYDYLKATDARGCDDQLVIDNEWYEYADNIQFGGGSCWGSMIDLGDKFASFRDYSLGNHRLLTKSEIKEDAGKAINFLAIGEHGDRIEIKGELGEDHISVTYNPWIRYFRQASKEATEGRVRVYIYDPNRGNTIICAIYEPDDLSPTYRRYRVSTRARSSYYMRCKRRYRELLRETDKVEFSTDTLIQACIAITARRKSDNDAYMKAMNLAVEHENQLIKDDKPMSGGHIKMSGARTIHNLITSNDFFPYTNRRFSRR